MNPGPGEEGVDGEELFSSAACELVLAPRKAMVVGQDLQPVVSVLVDGN